MPVGGSPPAAWQTISLDISDVQAVHGSLLEARRLFLAAGDRATATQIASVYLHFNEGLRKLGVDTANRADKLIRARIRATQKRPDTGRGGGLADNIKSAWWEPNFSVSVAWVSIARLDFLDRTVNPHSVAQRGVPYWRVQEYGHQYSHIPHGLFLGPGYSGPASAPNPALSRVHPLFVPSAKGRSFQNPPSVEARHFLRDGAAIAIQDWRAGVGRLQGRAIGDLQRLLRGRGRRP